jgi:hypothetical protein
MLVNGADADANEAVPMLMEQPLNRLSKIVASGIGVSVVMTYYKTSEYKTRDKERVCSF